MERVLLLREDADGDVEPPDQRFEIRAQDPCPLVADVAQLPREGCRRVASRGTEQLDERGPRPIADVEQLPFAEDALESGDRLLVARSFREDPVVDQLAQRPDRRVLVADPGQQEFLQLDRTRFGFRPDPRERGAEAVQEPVEVIAKASADVTHRGRHVRIRLAPDEQVADLVEEAERADVAGGDAGRLWRPGLVHPLGEGADRREIGDRQVATEPEQRVVDAVALAGGPADVEVARTVEGPVRGAVHRRRMARAGWRRQTAETSRGRSAATCSIARRRSSRPAGSNSYDHGRMRSSRCIWRSRPAASASRDMRMRSADSS